MKIKLVALGLIAVTAGVFAYTRPNTAIPSDLRDAVADKGFDTSIPSFEEDAGNIPVPKAEAVEGSVVEDALSATVQANSKPVYFNFSSCETMMDGLSVKLDFFEGFKSDIATGNGFVVQTTANNDGGRLVTMSALKLKGKGNDRRVLMYATLDPDLIFSQFEIPSKKTFQLEIFANTWGKPWGSFSCTSKLLE
jgi:hypothetical protein